jgi:hypothetical protein
MTITLLHRLDTRSRCKDTRSCRMIDGWMGRRPDLSESTPSTGKCVPNLGEFDYTRRKPVCAPWGLRGSAEFELRVAEMAAFVMV